MLTRYEIETPLVTQDEVYLHLPRHRRSGYCVASVQCRGWVSVCCRESYAGKVRLSRVGVLGGLVD